MNVFSKPVINKTSEIDNEKQNINSPNNTITYIDYYKKNIDLLKFKIPELKIIAKKNGLHISGTKKVLIERIKNNFKQLICIVKIQANYRRHLVQRLFKLHGPGLKNLKNCVNDSDFYTLDPIDEIDIYNFFSYKDNNDFIYAFHIQSLIKMFQKSKIGVNPYTRESFNAENIKKIYEFNKISNIIISGYTNPESNNVSLNSNISPVIENRVISINETNYQPNFTNARNHTLEKLEELRTKDFITRVNEVFMEIDLLGNYTQSSWFSNLNLYSYIKFIQNLYSIWTQRANMSLHVRSQICPYYNPFNYQIDTVNIFAAYNMNLNHLRNSALTIIENIVFIFK